MSTASEPTGRKSKRASKPKVRTGCVTCKIRRVKCDEAKPECLRCTSTGRKCDGYVPPKTWLFEPNRDTNPISVPSQGLQISTNNSEERALRWFRERTAPTLSNYCTAKFWMDIVPTGIRLHRPIKHIAIAIAELHESVEGLASQPSLSRLRYMQNYSKAVSLMTAAGTSSPTELVLICSLMFAICENLLGEPMTGLTHIEGGFRVLREWKMHQATGSQVRTRVAEMIEQDLAPIFEGMAGRLSAARHARSVSESWTSQTPPMGLFESGQPPSLPVKPKYPARYTNFCGARHHLDMTIDWARFCSRWDYTAPRLTADEAVTARDQVKSALVEWVKAFNAFEPHIGGDREREFLRNECRLLQTHQHAVDIIVSCQAPNSEMYFDKSIDSFRLLLDESSAAANTSTSPVNFHFGFSLGLIPPLFIIATRCRDPTMRRHAVSILNSLHQSEGIWDSCSAALIAEQVISIEERGLTVIRSLADVPSFSRVRLVGAKVDYSQQELVLRVLREPYDGEVEEERMAWSGVVAQEQDMVEWPLDGLLGCMSYQGLIRPERGICRHTADSRAGRTDYSIAVTTAPSQF